MCDLFSAYTPNLIIIIKSYVELRTLAFDPACGWDYSMAREAQVSVSFGGDPPQSVCLEVEEEDDVCEEAVDELLQWLQIPSEKKGAWHLVERWRGCGMLQAFLCHSKLNTPQV